jgi:hypothetical protein
LLIADKNRFLAYKLGQLSAANQENKVSSFCKGESNYLMYSILLQTAIILPMYLLNLLLKSKSRTDSTDENGIVIVVMLWTSNNK